MHSNQTTESVGPRLELRVPEKGTWSTPGASITDAIAGCREVLAVYEAVDQDRFTVLVLLEDDPEEILDTIFEAESLLYAKFRNMPFDVRVTKKLTPWADQKPSARMVLRYQRPS